MVDVAITGMAVAAVMVRVVVTLEQAVLPDNPPGFLGHVRPKHRGGQLTVIVG